MQVRDLKQAEYTRLVRRLYKALMPVWDEEEAAAAAQLEWHNDSRGAEAITKRLFFDVTAAAPEPQDQMPVRCKRGASEMARGGLIASCIPHQHTRQP